MGTQYRSGLYFYNSGQEKAMIAARSALQKELGHLKKVVTEIERVKVFHRAEENHQQFLEKGGRNGLAQSAIKGCCDKIRCYG